MAFAAAVAAEDGKNMIELKKVSKQYKMGDNIVHALREVSLTIEAGDFVAIMGPSGSGKSTLMHVLGLLDLVDSGSYQINGKETAKLSEDQLAVLRRDVIGFIFQQFNLLPRLTALENVALPLLYSENKMGHERAKELLERVGLGSRLDHHSNEMSGGQQQRVACARSLINQPLMILADEPTGNLDTHSREEIMGILRDLNASGITLVIVTHEEEIGNLAKRVIRMRDGVIVADERLAPLTKPPTLLHRKSLEESAKLGAVPLWQHLLQGIKTLSGNKVRTALSILGVLIGVGAVIAMLALGKGAQNAIEEQLASLGSNLLTVRTGGSRGPGGAVGESGAVARLSPDDAPAMELKIPEVKKAAPVTMGRGQVTFLNKNHNTQIMGVASAYAKMRADSPVVGRFFTDDENLRRSRVAVIGPAILRELFEGKNPIGEMLKINKVSFQVIGVLPEKGADSFQDQDDRILIPVFTAMRRLFGREHVNSIDVEAISADKVAVAQEKILELLHTRHKVALSQQDSAFQVRNMAEIQSAFTESTQIMTLLLSVIAAISLLVGGIGIMNIMLVSVTERTKEIGLRKAIGARRRDILSQFLVEAVVVSLVGGVCGIALAWVVTIALAYFAGWATAITAGSIFLAFGFSAAIGVVFGLYPAMRASLLPPIDALRHQ